jgi:hypothetical protein
VEFYAPMLSTQAERDAFLRELAGIDIHFDAAEVEPGGRARVEFPASDLDIRDVKDLQRWLELRPGVRDIQVSLAPDRAAPA